MTLSAKGGTLSAKGGTLVGVATPEVKFPADAGHVDVTDAPYGAAGDGVTDDWAALNSAFLANDWEAGSGPHLLRAAARTVYLPAGTYLVSDGFEIPGCSVRIVGAGEGLTTIKLMDGATGFESAASARYLLRTGEGVGNGQENAGFSNFVEHLTLDTGANNPGAIGCRYSVANAGAMRHVTIKSSDATRRGVYGLMFGTTAGPGYVADVTIEGFDYGIHAEGNSVNNIDFSGITLTDQRVRGVHQAAKVLAFEDLAISSGPNSQSGYVAVDLTDAEAVLFADGLTVDGPGTGQAITLQSTAYAWVRDVTASGWTNLITQGATDRFVGRTSIIEWGATSYQRGATAEAWGENSSYVGLNLPGTRAPEYNNSDLSQWACPQDFGYSGSGDVGPALQDAIDSGAKVVYLPYADYSLTSAVVVRGAVRKVEFMFSVVSQSGSGSLTIGETNDGVAILEHLVPDGTLSTSHNSTGTVVVRDNGNSLSYQTPAITTGSSATGDLFFESAGANQRVEISRPINAWLRQINRERAELIISGGATVRVFGDNVELSDTDVEADVEITDSTVEIIGASFDILAFDAYPDTGKAAFTVTDSTVSIVTAGYLRNGATLGHWVAESDDGAPVADIYGTGAGSNVYKPTTDTTHREVVQMYVSPSVATSALPWVMPTRSTMAAADRDVLAYCHTLPIYWRNSNPTNYADNILPSSSPTVGGRWRQRPYPFIENGSMIDADRIGYALDEDVSVAASIGIDCFTINILATAAIGTEEWRWDEHILPYYDAADTFSQQNTPGFKMCPNLSMLSAASSGLTDPVAWADRIKELLEHPAAYTWQDTGRPVVMHYNAGDAAVSWYEQFHARLLNTWGINAALIPSHQSNSPTDGENMDNYLSLWQSGIFVALHPWAGVDPTTPPATIHSSWRSWCATNSTTFVGAVGPAWENDRPDTLKQKEGQGLTVLQNSWQSSIDATDSFVQITSWNDHEESHNIRPSTGYQWVPYDITAYYLAWYKTGTAPVINRDAVYYCHRMQLSTASYDSQQQTAGDYNDNVIFGPVTNKIYTTVFLIDTADVIVTTGGVDQTHSDVPAGLTTLEDDLVADDTVEFRVVRGGVDVVPQFSSAFPTRSSIVYQDFLYRMGSSTRATITGVQSDLPQDRE